MIERANSGGATASAARPTARTSLKAPSRSTKARPCRRVDRRARSPVDRRRVARMSAAHSVSNPERQWAMTDLGSSTIHGGCESAIRRRGGDVTRGARVPRSSGAQTFSGSDGRAFHQQCRNRLRASRSTIGRTGFVDVSARARARSGQDGGRQRVGRDCRSNTLSSRWRRGAGASRSTRDSTFVARAGCAIMPWRVLACLAGAISAV